ncbi:MAG: ATP-grasp domain-containing protein [Sedimenticola sp.]
MVQKLATGLGIHTGKTILPVLNSVPTRRLYNHDIMHCTAEEVTGNEFYSARALGMTQGEDIIQLSPHLKPEWRAICAHYERVGLNHTQRVVWNTNLQQISLHPNFQPSVFFFGQDEYRAHRDKSWSDVVEITNSKNSFMVLANELGVPVPETICFERVDEITAIEAESFTYPCYLKAAISVSGVGIYRCEHMKSLLHAVKSFDPSTPVQVQEEVRTDCFLNMQYEVKENTYRRLLTSEQILEGTAHQGNVYPARHEPWEVVEPMAKWMAEQGFKDVFAFDVAVVEKDNETRYVAIECNPRFNGASYPTAIAMKLDIPEWESRYFKTWHTSLSGIDLKGLEYDATTGEGVVIVNWGPILVGKLMIMLAGPEPVRQRLKVELNKRLW